MKIAFATDDGTTITQNFQAARYYQVVTLQDGVVVERELRAKPQLRASDQGHIPLTGYDDSDMGGEMLDIIEDCSVLVAGSMPRAMHEQVMRYNVRSVLSNKTTIDEALQDFIQGSLDNPHDNIP